MGKASSTLKKSKSKSSEDKCERTSDNTDIKPKKSKKQKDLNSSFLGKKKKEGQFLQKKDRGIV